MTHKIQITLSDASPVTVDPEIWPILAEAADHDGQLACQANTEWTIKVRAHADGRRLVYGWEDRGPGGRALSYRGKYAGYLLERDAVDAAAADLEARTIRAIRRVAGSLDRDDLGDACIADLPARELT